MADFELDISRWVAQAQQRNATAPMAIAEALLTRVKELTPVLTGRARASWEIVPGDGNIEITTNVEYMRRLEYGFVGTDSLGRHYDQTGHGMVAQTIVEAPEIIKKVLDNL